VSTPSKVIALIESFTSDPASSARRLRRAKALAIGEAALAAAGEIAPAPTYTTERLPDGVSRRRFNEVCRSIEGATKEGRHWTCAREAWHRARSSQRCTSEASVVDPDAVAVDAFLRRVR
jgi:hypothetical protein